MLKLSTPFDDLLLEASNGHPITAEDLAKIQAPPGMRPEVWQATTLARLAGVVGQFADGERGGARMSALRLAAEYVAAFGKDGPPANPKPSDSVDTTDPVALAALVAANPRRHGN